MRIALRAGGASAALTAAALLVGCGDGADRSALERAGDGQMGEGAVATGADKGGAAMSGTKGGTAVKVRVTAQDAAELDRIADALQRSGLTVRQRLPELGLVTGDIDPTLVNGLMAVDGVSSVEPEGSVQLPPLDPEKAQ